MYSNVKRAKYIIVISKSYLSEYRDVGMKHQM